MIGPSGITIESFKETHFNDQVDEVTAQLANVNNALLQLVAVVEGIRAALYRVAP